MAAWLIGAVAVILPGSAVITEEEKLADMLRISEEQAVEETACKYSS
jgi:hypothetical protein